MGHRRMNTLLRPPRGAPTLAALLLASAACTQPIVTAFGTVEAGGACGQVSDCRAGLQCTNRICVEPANTAAAGGGLGFVCDPNRLCATGLVCGRQGVCTSQAPQGAGGVCTFAFDCEASLVCSSGGTCAATGSAGTVPLGGACAQLTDCQRPFVCGVTGTCTKIPYASGVDCTRTTLEVGDFRIYFEVPADPVPTPLEFYRLPFPNDIRVRDGHIVMDGHYTPGALLGLDLGTTYYDAIHASARGFATNAPVFFQASDRIDLRSVCLDTGGVYPAVASADALGGRDGKTTVTFCPNNDPASIYLVNVTKASPRYGEHVPVQLDYSSTAGLYICQNWLGVAPLDGMPLESSTTYAVVVTKAITNVMGDAPIGDADFLALQGTTLPSGARPELIAAHAAMAPLRQYLSDFPNLADDVAAAAVFTTGDPDGVAQALRAAVYATPTPTFDNPNIVVCGDPNAPTSPCDDGFPMTDLLRHRRGCFPASNPNYYELQGRYTNPVMQDGNRPYATAGGNMLLDPNGIPLVQGSESVCFALTVPKGRPMPVDGWPVVIYAHGTEGSFRTFTLPGPGARSVADELTDEGFAVISFDNVAHGWRQGNDPNAWSPLAATLFFNLANPTASRDNIFQGAADLHQLVRLVQHGGTITKAISAGSTPVLSFQLDPDKVLFVGHSQGTVIAPPFLVANPNIKGAVLAGAGGELPLSILHKRQPIDFSQVAGAFFGDRSLKRVHPMMGVLALLFGPSDAVNYAADFAAAPLPGNTALPVFHVMGVEDTFTPDVTQHALARAGKYPIVGPLLVPVTGVDHVATTTGTIGAAQYSAASGSNGHFVMFDNPAATAAVRNFLRTAASGQAVITP
jgi:pimeloyl-ACP methyl ester carboxylesterase